MQWIKAMQQRTSELAKPDWATYRRLLAKGNEAGGLNDADQAKLAAAMAELGLTFDDVARNAAVLARHAAAVKGAAGLPALEREAAALEEERSKILAERQRFLEAWTAKTEASGVDGRLAALKPRLEDARLRAKTAADIAAENPELFG